MNIPKAEDLTNIIDTAKIAVDNSDFGPMFVRPQGGVADVTQKAVNQLAWGVFNIVLASILQGALKSNVDIPKDTPGVQKDKIPSVQ